MEHREEPEGLDVDGPLPPQFPDAAEDLGVENVARIPRLAVLLDGVANPADQIVAHSASVTPVPVSTRSPRHLHADSIRPCSPRRFSAARCTWGHTADRVHSWNRRWAVARCTPNTVSAARHVALVVAMNSTVANTVRSSTRGRPPSSRDDREGLQQFVSASTWDPAAVRERLAARAVDALGPQAWVVDGTGFPQDGRASPRGGPAVFGQPRQGRHVPDRRHGARGHRRRVLPAGLAAVPAAELG